MVRSEGLIRNIFNIKKECYMIEKTGKILKTMRCRNVLLDSQKTSFGLRPSLSARSRKFGMTKNGQDDKKWLGMTGLVRKGAFTMAEILLSLTIIGVVAAITLPSLIGNINERTWNTQKKALHARMAQALALMPQLNGYGTYSTSTDANGSAVINDNSAQTFITEGLSKVLKITNVCDYQKLEDCGVASTYTTLAGTTKNVATNLRTFNPLITATYTNQNRVNEISFNYNTYAAAFETQNGESIILYYNPFCQDNKDIPEPATGQVRWDHAQQYMCANFVVDLNGAKGPNKVGQDISFITAIYPNNPDVVAPDFLPAHGNDANSYKYDDSNANTVTATTICRNMGSEYRLPTLAEGMAMTYNRDLLGLSSSFSFWSGSAFGSSHAWAVSMGDGSRYTNPRTITHAVRCVKR